MVLLTCLFVFIYSILESTVLTSANSRHRLRVHAVRKARDSSRNESVLPASRSFADVVPFSKAQRLFTAEPDDDDALYIFFTGDPQYHFQCTDENLECKRRSAICRQQNSARYSSSEHTAKVKRSLDTIPEECSIIESTFANEVQRKSIFNLNRRLSAANISVVALIINGDLTQHGHAYQLELFKTEWLSLPIPIFAGLGNHDYENNVEDCLDNQCAGRMLSWFTNEYAPNLNLRLDHTESNILWKEEHHGSLAYSVNFCSRTRTNCVHSVQLNNRPGYTHQIGAVGAQWNIHSSYSWLANDLNAITAVNSSWPILVNLHNYNNEASSKRLHAVLEQWMKRPENAGIQRRVLFLFAHWHSEHSVTVKCLGGVNTPFIFVGSVPNNRYSLIKFSNEMAHIFLLQANANSTTSIVEIYDYKWTPCST